MKTFRSLLMVMAMMLVSIHVEARHLSDDAIDTSSIESARLAVVSPGTRLAAGDSSQNEFYILGRASTSASTSTSINAPVVRAKSPVRTSVASKANLTRIKVAINRSLHQASIHKKASKAKLAIKAKKHRLARK